MQETTIEFYTNTEDGDTFEVTVDFEYVYEDAEYLEGYLYQAGGVYLESYSVVPFTFKGKDYTRIDPAMLTDMVISLEFESRNGMQDRLRNTIKRLEEATLSPEDYADEYELTLIEADTLIDLYIEWIFDNKVAPYVSLPSKYDDYDGED